MLILKICNKSMELTGRPCKEKEKVKWVLRFKPVSLLLEGGVTQKIG